PGRRGAGSGAAPATISGLVRPFWNDTQGESAWRGQSPASVRQLPHLHRVVRTPRGQPLAVRAEGHAVDRVGMPLESQDVLTGGHVPYLHRPIPKNTARGKPLAVRAEGHACDRVRVPLEGADFFAGGRVPHLQRPVLTGRGQPLAVRAESYTPHD